MLLDTLHEDSASLQSPDQPMEESSNQNTECESHDPNPPNLPTKETQKSKERGSVVTQTFRGMLKNEVGYVLHVFVHVALH